MNAAVHSGRSFSPAQVSTGGRWSAASASPVGGRRRGELVRRGPSAPARATSRAATPFRPGAWQPMHRIAVICRSANSGVLSRRERRPVGRGEGDDRGPLRRPSAHSAGRRRGNRRPSRRPSPSPPSTARPSAGALSVLLSFPIVWQFRQPDDSTSCLPFFASPAGMSPAGFDLFGAARQQVRRQPVRLLRPKAGSSASGSTRNARAD